MKVCAVILAAGKGERFGSDKTQAWVGGVPVWRRSFEVFLSHPLVSGVGIVGSPTNIAAMRAGAPEALFVIQGGENRQESSLFGVAAVPAQFDIVLIHDAARPFVNHETITSVVRAIETRGAAAAAVSSVDTLRQKHLNGWQLVDRTAVVGMQTPQGALRELLLTAHQTAAQVYTDEMELIAALGHPFEVVAGDPRAFKITTPEDLERARGMLGGVEIRTGLGYDIHSFSTDPERPMFLGGVRFEGPGLDGHSDADVIIHAVVDALLGAAALGDIGQHFPNTDPRWKGEPSSTFLHHAASLLKEGGWEVVNVDISVLAEHPKVMPKALEIREELARQIGLTSDRVSLKATTNERLGAIGRGEGIAAFAVATIKRT